MGGIAVMGAGSWGTAFATICVDAGEDVVLWAREPQVAEGIERDRRNPRYLTDVDLPRERLRATSDAEVALHGAEVVALALPSHALRENLEAWRDVVPRTAIAASLIKGVEPATRQRASQVIREVLDLPYGRVVVVSGPNLARECARRAPSGTVAASPESAVARRVQVMCHTPAFRVWTNPDVVGVEVGGAVKNVVAIAAGMADGLGHGDNTKAMLITRGLAEMTRLGVALGGNPLTFSGLAGAGDLVATCTSRQSRNRHVGEQLGRGRPLAEVVDEMTMVAEGVKSSRAILELARDHEVEMPIAEHVVRVCHEGMDPAEVAASLMGRPPRSEFHGIPEVAEGAA